ncbi:MAG: hypothetical protein AMXMBFR78_36480 [Rubrivivax sp.]
MLRKLALWIAGFLLGNSILLASLREFGDYEKWILACLAMAIAAFLGFVLGFSFICQTSKNVVFGVLLALAAWYVWTVLLTYGFALVALPAIALISGVLLAGRWIGDRVSSGLSQTKPPRVRC